MIAHLRQCDRCGEAMQNRFVKVILLGLKAGGSGDLAADDVVDDGETTTELCSECTRQMNLFLKRSDTTVVSGAAH